jgi:hypothetical protein
MPLRKMKFGFSRPIRNNSQKNLRRSGNQFTDQARFLIKKPACSAGYVECFQGWLRLNMGTRFLFITIGFALSFAAPVLAAENSLLARITVYWPGEGQLRACSNGARLRAGHCAVDPKRIPYGSHVLFPDATCVAVDSGPAVVSRAAARACARTAAQRNALVIDRFFESKEAALSWERSHPHFMTVRVLVPGSRAESAETMVDATNADAVPAPGEIKTNSKRSRPSLPKFESTKLQLGLPLDSVLGPAQRRT